MTTSIPREVNGKWYPVPCPEWVSAIESFATEAECAAFLRAAEIMEEAWAEREEELVRKMSEDAEAAESQAYDNGYDCGLDEGVHKGYDQGHEDGVKETEERLAKTA